MVDWWKYNGPPAYVAAAAYMGLIQKRPVKKTKDSNVDSSSSGNLNELLKLAGPGGMIN